jgi:hypothetical protein
MKKPSRVHSVNRRCRVDPVPKARGTAFHWQPVRSRYTMPARIRRSSRRGRPPSGPLGRCGINGSAIAHTSSGMSSKLFPTNPSKHSAIHASSFGTGSKTVRKGCDCRGYIMCLGQASMSGQMSEGTGSESVAANSCALDQPVPTQGQMADSHTQPHDDRSGATGDGHGDRGLRSSSPLSGPDRDRSFALAPAVVHVLARPRSRCGARSPRHGRAMAPRGSGWRNARRAVSDGWVGVGQAGGRVEVAAAEVESWLQLLHVPTQQLDRLALGLAGRCLRPSGSGVARRGAVVRGGFWSAGACRSSASAPLAQQCEGMEPLRVPIDLWRSAQRR